MKRDLKADKVERSIKRARESNAMLCKKMLLEFKKVIAEAKGKYAKQTKKDFLAELAVHLGGCLIIASTCTRQLLIRVGDDLNKWIRDGVPCSGATASRRGSNDVARYEPTFHSVW